MKERSAHRSLTRLQSNSGDGPENIDPENWLAREVFGEIRGGDVRGPSPRARDRQPGGVVWLARREYRVHSESEADNAALFRQTMGSMKKALLSRRPDIDHLDDLLIRAIRLRNFLAHEYFRQRAAALMTEDGKHEMIAELEDAVALSLDADARLSPLTMEIIKAAGVDKHMPEAMESVRQMGFGDPLPGLPSSEL